MKHVIIISLLATITLTGQENGSERIDSYLEPYLTMNAWSGVIGVYQQGKPLFTKAYGHADREWETPMTTSAKFRIASVSKLFTKVAIMVLEEQRKLSLTDYLDKFIPDYPRGNEIQIKHLLNHRSGIPHLNAFENYDTLIKFSHDISDLIALFRNKPLEFEPGSRYRYSNSGYVLLALIIEQISGTTYEEFLSEEILLPNQLFKTGIDDQNQILKERAKGYMFDPQGKLIHAQFVDMSIKIGGGSLYSNLDDLARFTHLLNSEKIISNPRDKLLNYGQKLDQAVFTANGRVQGFCHQITHWLEQDLMILVLGNHYSNIALPISDDIYAIVNDLPYKQPINYESIAIDLPQQAIDKLVGVYDFGFGPIGEVVNINGKVGYKTPGTQDFDVLLALGDSTFFYKQNWVVLEFSDLIENKFQTLEWVMGNNRYPAKRVEGLSESSQED